MHPDDEYHPCHFCGDSVNREGYDPKGDRHFLSDCRPDLVEHVIGETCTWAFRRSPEYQKSDHEEPYPENRICYAYQDNNRNWTDEHKHFYRDGPM